MVVVLVVDAVERVKNPGSFVPTLSEGRMSIVPVPSVVVLGSVMIDGYNDDGVCCFAIYFCTIIIIIGLR